MKQKKWQIQAKLKAKDGQKRRDELVKILLGNRGIKNKKKQEDFFNPQNPLKIPFKETGIKVLEVKKAITRIKRAIKKQELVVIYGDYDADGITATAILWEALNELKAKVFPFIPHRENHGYGLNKKGLDSLLEQYGKPDLIITVDNGIVAFEGAEYCQKLAIDLIISDHHQKKSSKVKNQKTKQKLPKALAIVQTDKLAGAGVAWFLAREIKKAVRLHLNHSSKEQTSSSRLELAAIGTIADMMPLLEINRSLVKFGLEQFKNTQRPGLKTLFTEAQIDLNQVSTYNISFIIAPRLNAMGRLEHGLDSLRLLCTKDEQRAIRLAVNLGNVNKQRQDLTFSVLKHAQEEVASSKENKKQRLLFISHESYNHGVIGLVAGKLVEKFWRPTIVVAKGKNHSKGSVRSVPGVNIIEMLRQFENDFVDLGGHPMAAGFTIKTNKLPEIQKKLENLAIEQISEDLLLPNLEIECEIDLGDINYQLYRVLEKFEPFGIGNRRPVLAAKKINIIEYRNVGRDGKHVRLKLKAEGVEIFEAIFFNGAKKVALLDSSQPVDVAFQIDENNWNGQKSLQLVIKEIRQANFN